MKTYKECNAREKKAWNNIKYAAEDYIFSLQSGCFDNAKGSQLYNDCYARLKDLNGLIEKVYGEALSAHYGEGFTDGSASAIEYIKDIRFCGKEFLMEVVTHFCTMYQSEALADLA